MRGCHRVLPPPTSSTLLPRQSTTINTTQRHTTAGQHSAEAPLPGACAVGSLTCQMSPGQGCPAQGGHITDNASPPPLSPPCPLPCLLPPICTITTTPHRLFGHRDRNYSSIQLQTSFHNVLFKTPILPIAGVLSIRTKNN